MRSRLSLAACSLLLLVGAGCASTPAAVPSASTVAKPAPKAVPAQEVPPAEKPAVVAAREVPSYIADQGIVAAKAAGWMDVSNENLDGPTISFSYPRGFESTCSPTGSAFVCSLAKDGSSAPGLTVVVYRQDLDNEYVTSGFSNEGTTVQFGYTGGNEYANVTMRESKAFSIPTGIIPGASAMNAFAFSSLETGPYGVLVLDPGANWDRADWVTLLSTVTVIGTP